jgi:hypothetical protein
LGIASVVGVEIVPLGTGGLAPSGARETACTLVREGNRALVLDLGTGARRFLTDATLLDGVGEIDVLLTHFQVLACGTHWPLGAELGSWDVQEPAD